MLIEKDFRSKNGLHTLGIRFDIQNLRPDKRGAFLIQLAGLRRYASTRRPTTSHDFLLALRRNGQLLRCYTQNIDMLEEKAGLSTGISDANVCITLHGDLRMLRCSLCQRTVNWRPHESTILAGITSACTFCTERRERRIRLGRRSISAGYLRPDVVLLGEEHPHGEIIGTVTTKDLRSRPDFLLILGSSLVHHGPAQLAKEFSKAVLHSQGTVVVVNISPPRQNYWSELATYTVQWDCDSWVTDLQKRMAGVQNAESVPGCLKNPISSASEHSQLATGRGKGPPGSEGNPIVLD